MDSDKDQQALAWQQIIRNKAFDNVRVQRGESWVDAACRTLDELIDQNESLDKKFAKLMSDYQDIEDERDEWKVLAKKAHADWEGVARELADFRAEHRELKTPVFDVDVERTIRAEFVEEGFRTKTSVEHRVVQAVCELFGVEQAVDPIEAKARELYRAVTPDARWETVADEYRRIARYVLGRENHD